MKGTVKWFDEEKGIGFITGENGKDIFAHYSQIKREGFKVLRANEKVEYRISSSELGIQADSIVIR